MAGTDRVKEQILDKADIGEIVSQYVRLQNRGGRYFGLCPFHKEKTPSFSVNPERGFYHCFGCGKGGNVIDFIMGVENLTYAEARRYMAEKLGIAIETPSGQPRSHSEIDRYQVMEQAAQFYAKCLSTHAEAQKYLQSRQLNPQAIRQFGLGFAPDNWDSLLSTMRQRRIPEKVLEELGLIIPRRENGGYYDRFRNRIMFPIRNTLGRVIAFGGRSMDPKDRAKYLNSNDTPLFNKSKVLYLLDRAKEVLKERGAILVEGYMDAISLHVRGFQQAVASLGTALTADHIQILRRYTQDFILLYDGDLAGIRAAMRGVELFFESGYTARVVLLPKGMDPDDYIKKHGPEALQTSLNNAENGFDFYVQQVAKNHDVKTTRGKMAIVESTIPLFARMNDPLIVKDSIIQLAKQLDNQEVSVVESTVQKKLKSGKFTSYTSTPEKVEHSSSLPVKDAFAAIKEPLIRMLALHRGLLIPAGVSARQAATLLSQEHIQEIAQKLAAIRENTLHDTVLERLIEEKGTNRTGNQTGNQAAALAGLFPDPQEMAFFIAVTESVPLPNVEKELDKMREELLEALRREEEKRTRQAIMKQDDPKKALQAFHERLLAERQSSQTNR